MKEISFDNLVKGREYYIAHKNPSMFAYLPNYRTKSFRVRGIFDKRAKSEVNWSYGDEFAIFRDMSEIVHADGTLGNGGEQTEDLDNNDRTTVKWMMKNKFDKKAYKFYEPTAKALMEQSILRQALAQTINKGTNSDIGTRVSNNMSSYLGGRRTKSTRYNKRKTVKKNKMTKKKRI